MRQFPEGIQEPGIRIDQQITAIDRMQRVAVNLGNETEPAKPRPSLEWITDSGQAEDQ